MEGRQTSQKRDAFKTAEHLDPYLHAFSSALEEDWLIRGGNQRSARPAKLKILHHLPACIL